MIPCRFNNFENKKRPPCRIGIEDAFAWSHLIFSRYDPHANFKLALVTGGPGLVRLLISSPVWFTNIINRFPTLHGSLRDEQFATLRLFTIKTL